MKTIRNAISTLFFDKEVVNNLKDQHLQEEILYTYLISGKISLKEYLSLV